MTEVKRALISSLPSPVVVVCHDAGAANLIFAWLRDWAALDLLSEHIFRLVLKGPAAVTWSNLKFTLPNAEIHEDLGTAMFDSAVVLSGTGWASDLEHDARKLAARMHIPSIAVVDHWVNYSQRFERAGEVVLPDFIWVTDSYAAQLAITQFPTLPVIELENTYLKNIVDEIVPIQESCNKLLYVLEPIRNDWGREKPGEFQALDFFVQNLALIVGKQQIQITIRPHPSDPPGKYLEWVESCSGLNIILDTSLDLAEAISQSRWVVGAETFAMVIAVEAGRETYSSLPPWAHKCRLPHASIIHLADLVSGRSVTTKNV